MRAYIVWNAGVTAGLVYTDMELAKRVARGEPVDEAAEGFLAEHDGQLTLDRVELDVKL